MKFDTIFDGIEYTQLNKIVNEIVYITHDSRCVRQDYCYVCLIGKEDGHNFINDAIANGATTVVIQDDSALNLAYCYDKYINVTFVSVKDTRASYGTMAGNYYANPDRDLKVIGITGTNGKTTTCKIVYDILRRIGYRTGLIGTVCNFIGSDRLESSMTTPDPMQFYELLRAMANSGCEYAVTEASAHAIFLHKIDSCKFAALGFTNLSQDHMDFFTNMDTYKAAKKSLFHINDCPITVNADDLCGEEILLESDSAVKISYSIDTLRNNKQNNVSIIKKSNINKNYIDICAILNQNSPNCEYYSISIGNNLIKIKSGLRGKFNVYNVLCAIGILISLGFNENEIIPEIEFVLPPDGRFETRVYKGISFVVDYAHTPDGMDKVLSETRAFTEGKLYCVFGCGGDRDKTKRPIMGAIAEKYCDKIILTSDNPRYEDRMAIIEEIYNGISDINKVVKCAVRFHAILYACKSAKSGDTIAILGKGHENYIEENGIKIEYSDINSIERLMGFNWNDEN